MTDNKTDYGSVEMSFHDNSSVMKNASTIETYGFNHGITLCDFAPNRLPPRILTLLAVVYLVIIVTALLGNLLVIVVIAADRKMRTVTNVLLVSLAVSDALMAGLNMPFQLKFLMQNEWTMGETLCKFINYLQGVVVVTSIFTLNGIAIDRYYAICHPLQARHLHTIGRAVLLVCCFWLVAAVILVPQLFIQRVGRMLTFDGPNSTLTNVEMCDEHFPDFRLNVAYTVFFYVFLYVIPVLVVLVAYGRIGVTLWYRSPMVEIPARSRVESSRRRSAEKQRVVRMLIVIVVFFTVSWFPLFTAQVYMLFDEGTCQLHYWFRSVAAGLHLVAFSNSCVNPVVYCLLNDSFKQSLRRGLAKACTRRWWRLKGSGRRSTLLSDTVRTTVGLFSSSHRRGSFPTGALTRQLSSPPQRPVSPAPEEKENQPEREALTLWNRAEVGNGRCHGDRLLGDKTLASDAKVLDKYGAICARPNEMQESNSVDPEMTTPDDLTFAAADISTGKSSVLQPKSLFPARNLEASMDPKKTPETMDDNERRTATHSVGDKDGDISQRRSNVEPINGTVENEDNHPMMGLYDEIRKILEEEENNSETKPDCQTLDIILSQLLMDAGVQD